MSIDIIIKQKGFSKKTLPLSVLTGGELAYGTYENGYRLSVGKIEGEEIMLFHPDHIGRGFSVTWTPDEKNQVILRALNPTCADELRDFYAVVARITKHWKCSLTVDGNRTTPEKFQQGLDDMLRANDSFLNLFISEALKKDEYGSIALYSALWPMDFGAKEAKMVSEAPEGASARFARWLHEMQSVDAYYAVAGYFDDPKGIYGRLAFTEGCRSIFPVKPSVPFGLVDPHTGRALECDKYELYLYSTSLETHLGTVDYAKFINALDPAKVSTYDTGHVMIEAHDLNEMKELLRRMQES